MNSGIYQITCHGNNKKYIGSSMNLKSRKSEHFNSLLNNRHKNKYLQNAFNKYGEDDFEFKILCYYEPSELIFQEQRFLDYYKPFASDRRFNIYTTADSPKGFVMSDEQKNKLSLAHKGKKLSEGHKQKIGLASKGRFYSEETRQKISKAHKGKIMSEESKQKMSKSAIGRRLSNETKKKLSELNTGEKHYFFGKRHNKETKDKMSISAKKRGISKKTREKMKLSRIKNIDIDIDIGRIG